MSRIIRNKFSSENDSGHYRILTETGTKTTINNTTHLDEKWNLMCTDFIEKKKSLTTQTISYRCPINGEVKAPVSTLRIEQSKDIVSINITSSLTSAQGTKALKIDISTETFNQILDYFNQDDLGTPA